MQLAMTLLVRDEEDIIKANLDYHLANGIDFAIVTDNLSRDQTPGILEGYVRSGRVQLLHEDGDDYSQAQWVTRMARLAAQAGADWIINSDADEFWFSMCGDLKDTFNSVPAEIGVVEVPRHNYVCIEGDMPFWMRMVWRERESRNSLGRLLPMKVAHRASSTVEVAQGNHAVTGVQPEEVGKAPMEILHFPLRSRRQLTNKIRYGGAAYERNSVLDPSIGDAWRSLYRELQETGHLETYLSTAIPNRNRLAARIEAGELIADRRLADFFKSFFTDNLPTPCKIQAP